MATKTNIAILPTYTINNIVKPMVGALANRGIEANVKIGGFHEHNTDLLSASSWLAEFKPDFVFIPLSVRSILPDLFVKITEKDFTIDIALAQLHSLLQSIENSAHHSTIILTTLEMPIGSPLSHRDISTDGVTVFNIVTAANNEIISFAKKHPIVALFDFAGFVAQYGASRLTDEKLWYLGSMLLTSNATNALATQIAASIGARFGASKKCIVVDLDNTLWGGTIGEDGISALQLGNSKIGDIYVAIQQRLLAFKRQGILLAIASKNNESDVLPMFADPRMILKYDDFAAMKINWGLKSKNISEIASQLNIGVDSFVFIDDNPAERLEVASALPQVSVLDFPADVAQLPALLAAQSLDLFATGALTAEDRDRAKMYIEDKKRKSLETSTSSLKDYLHALKIKIDVRKNDLSSLVRIAQLINKTNQFNLRTQRYTEAQVKDFMKSSDSLVLSMSVSDSFGDMGLTSVAICTKVDTNIVKAKKEETWFIDSFLLSCRILGRDIELQFFQELLNALPSSVTKMRAEFIATPKNSQVESFYEKLGFSCTDKNAERKLYIADTLALKRDALSWIQVHQDF